jgi:hypothetical protein
MSTHQNVQKNHDLMTGSKSLKNVAKLKHLEMKVKNQDCIHEEIMRRLKLH